MESFEMQTTSQGELSAVASAASAKAEIEAGYVMALRKPRNIDDVRTRILAAVSRPIFAQTAEYAKPMGKEKVRGPSIRFAEMALQAAGNIRTSAITTYEDERLRKIRVTVTDLETNISFGKEVTIQKTVERTYLKDGQTPISSRTNSLGKTTYLVYATEDELANKQAAAESKILRNEGLRLIPKDIIEEAMQVARETRNKNGGDPKAALNKIIDAFSGLGIQPSEIEKSMGKKLAQLLPADIDELRQRYTAIRDGEARWSDYLEDAATEDPNKKLNSIPDQVPDAPNPFAGINPKFVARAKAKLDLKVTNDQLTPEGIAAVIAEAKKLEGEDF